MKLILASKSPRRAELLHNIGLEFEVRCTETDETVPKQMTEPCEIVKYLSRLKALAMKDKISDDELVIAADTLVFHGSERLGKPKDRADAVRILKSLSGDEHTVATGFTLMTSSKTYTEAVASKVYFKMLSESEIERYVETGEPMDKAGAYGIQGLAGKFVERIDGDVFSVIGLPICALCSALQREFGVEI